MTLDNLNYVCAVPANLDLPRTVYKYRCMGKRLLESLLLNQVWLAQPKTFNDPFEPVRMLSGTPFSAALQRDVDEAGVLCLSKSAKNLPMWSQYGDGLRGVAIGYDLRKLLETLCPVTPHPETYGHVWKYVFDLDYDNEGLKPIQEMNLLQEGEARDRERQKLFATKAISFSQEKECRIVVRPSPDSTAPDAYPGYGLYQHAPEAITEIVFGELMPQQDREAIIATMNQRQIQYADARRDSPRFEILVTECGKE